MDLQLKGKTALITGASKGIGAGLAKVFAEEGCNLHLAARNGAAMKSLSDELTNKFDKRLSLVIFVEFISTIILLF